jgi:hypothetical protein
MKEFKGTTEIMALAVLTRDQLRMNVLPNVRRAIALTGPPVSATRAGELLALLRITQLDLERIANLHLYAIKGRRAISPRVVSIESYYGERN